jgi:hypothetical protein
MSETINEAIIRIIETYKKSPEWTEAALHSVISGGRDIEYFEKRYCIKNPTDIPEMDTTVNEVHIQRLKDIRDEMI